MYQVELFANYSLRDLLPKELIMKMPKIMNRSEGNTILLLFENELDKDNFLSVCRKHNFEFRMSKD